MEKPTPEYAAALLSAARRLTYEAIGGPRFTERDKQFEHLPVRTAPASNLELIAAHQGCPACRPQRPDALAMDELIVSLG